MKKITLLALLTIIGIFGVSLMAFADNSTLSVSPVSLDNTVNKIFNLSIQIDPVNNKVCVVKGALSFDNLSCQSITLASGVTAQSVPTCADSDFILGIPRCATTSQNILSVSVKGVQVGQAKLSFTGVNVIGAGVAVPFNSQAGVYNITAVQTTMPVTTQQNTQTTIPETTQQNIRQQSQIVTQEVETLAQETQEATSENNIAANVGIASLVTTGSKFATYLWIAFIILVILCVWYGIYYFQKKKNKNNQK